MKMTNGMLRAVALAIVALGAVTTGARAQDDPAEVEAVIVRLFDAMRAGDTTAVRATFHEDMTLMSTGTNPEGQPVVGGASADRFVASVGQQPAGSLDERLGPSEIWVEDNLATARMKYAFHYDGALSHCGVNVFMLARTADGWKIISVADTRRQAGCEDWLK